MINVYIDGACSNNGKENAKAGYGVYFGPDDSRNESNRIVGKQTNNVGELTALIRALQILKKEIEDVVEINIYTDSQYVIKCVRSVGPKLSIKNWKSSKVPNLELVKIAYTLFSYCKNVKIFHIRAHTDNTDIHSVGNNEADKLANKSIDEKQCPYAVENIERYYINVSYAKKDIAKEHGAKWDANTKKWYYTSNTKTEFQDFLKEHF